MFSDLQRKIIEYYINNGCNVSGKDISNAVDCDERYARKVIQFYKDYKEAEAPVEEDEKEEFFLTLQRQKQNLQDSNRIERATIRKKNRLDNALIALNKELINIFKDRPVHEIKTKISLENEYNAVIQLSDMHMNELVEMDSNRYDFTVASRRLQKYAYESKRILKVYGVKNVLIALTGDGINSDRRDDELLSCATNRSRATALTSLLLEQFILDLSEDFIISIAFVTGNESRVGDEYGSTEIMTSDNYDYMIFEFLKMMFRDTEIQFIEGNSTAELVVNVNGKNILLLHGQQIGKNSIVKDVQMIKGKYADQEILIDYLLFGHIHECLIADLYARSSSLVGANAYSDKTLQLTSRASQNIHIVGESINSIKIDLQETKGFEGYEFDKNLVAYNAKSASKGKYSNYLIVKL